MDSDECHVVCMTGLRKWTAVAALLTLAMGLVVTFVVAQVWRLLA